MKFIQKLLLYTYSTVQRTGLLDNVFMQAIFKQGYWFYKSHFEDPFANLGKKSPEMFAGGYIIDVGANIGYTAQVFAGLLTDPYQVFAFEPEPTNYEALVRNNHKLIKAGKLQAEQAAIGNTQGQVRLSLNPDHHADHKVVSIDTAISDENYIDVQQYSLDYFCKERRLLNQVKFIKIDVQGYELAVCEGMSNLLVASPNAVVALEYSPNSMLELNYKPDDLFTFFVSRDYQMALICQSGKIAAITREELDLLVTKLDYVDLLFFKNVDS